MVKGEQHEQKDPVKGSHHLLVFLHHGRQVGCMKASVNLGLGPLVLPIWYKLPEWAVLEVMMGPLAWMKGLEEVGIDQ